MKINNNTITLKINSYLLPFIVLFTWLCFWAIYSAPELYGAFHWPVCIAVFACSFMVSLSLLPGFMTIKISPAGIKYRGLFKTHEVPWETGVFVYLNRGGMGYPRTIQISHKLLNKRGISIFSVKGMYQYELFSLLHYFSSELRKKQDRQNIVMEDLIKKFKRCISKEHLLKTMDQYFVYKTRSAEIVLLLWTISAILLAAGMGTLNTSLAQQNTLLEFLNTNLYALIGGGAFLLLTVLITAFQKVTLISKVDKSVYVGFQFLKFTFAFRQSLGASSSIGIWDASYQMPYYFVYVGSGFADSIVLKTCFMQSQAQRYAQKIAERTNLNLEQDAVSKYNSHAGKYLDFIFSDLFALIVYVPILLCVGFALYNLGGVLGALI